MIFRGNSDAVYLSCAVIHMVSAHLPTLLSHTCYGKVLLLLVGYYYVGRYP